MVINVLFMFNSFLKSSKRSEKSDLVDMEPRSEQDTTSGIFSALSYTTDFDKN